MEKKKSTKKKKNSRMQFFRYLAIALVIISIICVGLIYFINVNNKKKKDLSINILISSFILPMVSSFTYFIYSLIKDGFHTNYLLDIIGIGLGVAFGLILFDILEKYLK